MTLAAQPDASERVETRIRPLPPALAPPPLDAERQEPTIVERRTIVNVPTEAESQAAAWLAKLPPPVVLPTPRQITMEQWEFALDDLVVVMVSGQATRTTRRAARILQFGLRERLGLDPPIVRFLRRGELPPGSKAIWIVEPRLGRGPQPRRAPHAAGIAMRGWYQSRPEHVRKYEFG